tara:strand:- start:2071 stop:2604 length:534 start_codon:yes stop_codon:yes gene_type:complete
MTIRISLQGSEKPTQESISLQVSRTLDGNLLINDHKYIDIVVNPIEGKVATLSKPEVDRDVYEYQRDLMYHLFKGGITDAANPQGGPVFGLIETSYPLESDINPLETVLFLIQDYIQRSSDAELVADKYDQNIEDRFTEPTDEDSTEYGEITPYEDTPKAYQTGDPTYTFAGYGYLY